MCKPTRSTLRMYSQGCICFCVSISVSACVSPGSILHSYPSEQSEQPVYRHIFPVLLQSPTLSLSYCSLIHTFARPPTHSLTRRLASAVELKHISLSQIKGAVDSQGKKERGGGDESEYSCTRAFSRSLVLANVPDLFVTVKEKVPAVNRFFSDKFATLQDQLVAVAFSDLCVYFPRAVRKEE